MNNIWKESIELTSRGIKIEKNNLLFILDYGNHIDSLNADLLCLINDFINAIETDDRKALSYTVKEAISVLVEFGGRDEMPTKVQ
jgi:hypothetical protein